MFFLLHRLSNSLHFMNFDCISNNHHVFTSEVLIPSKNYLLLLSVLNAESVAKLFNSHIKYVYMNLMFEYLSLIWHCIFLSFLVLRWCVFTVLLVVGIKHTYNTYLYIKHHIKSVKYVLFRFYVSRAHSKNTFPQQFNDIGEQYCISDNGNKIQIT